MQFVYGAEKLPKPMKSLHNWKLKAIKRNLAAGLQKSDV